MHMIPAVCKKCGLVFPAFGGPVGSVISMTDCQAGCPRCGQWAHVPNGFYEILQDAIVLVQDPKFGRRDAEALVTASQALQYTDTPARTVIANVAAQNPDAASRLATWAGIGVNFAAAMATVVGVLLTHIENRSNGPLMERAVTALERHLDSAPQPEVRRPKARSLAPSTVPSPQMRPGSYEKPLIDRSVERHRQRTGAEAPKENRHARRARIAKERARARD